MKPTSAPQPLLKLLNDKYPVKSFDEWIDLFDFMNLSADEQAKKKREHAKYIKTIAKHRKMAADFWFSGQLSMKEGAASNQEIEDEFELSESQCQDPYSIAKQEGQIQGATWYRDTYAIPGNKIIVPIALTSFLEKKLPLLLDNERFNTMILNERKLVTMGYELAKKQEDELLREMLETINWMRKNMKAADDTLAEEVYIIPIKAIVALATRLNIKDNTPIPEPTLFTAHEIIKKLLELNPQIDPSSEYANPHLYQDIREWYDKLKALLTIK